MENQHRRISGYRELNLAEIELMNKIKALGPQVEAVLEEVRLHLINQAINEDGSSNLEVEERHVEATPVRFLALAKTELQTGLMYMTRAVAQPTFF